jgi:pimeloyl-ACP methyl ester carboxylesterase
MSTSTVRANGLEIAFHSEGSGPPLILLHGATSMGTRDWGAQRPLLRAEFTLYMPDARGHHRTVYDVRAGWSHGALVDDVLAFADALDFARFHLVGLSMGARTGLELASRYPERVSSLTVISGSVELDPAASVARRRLDAAAIERDDPTWAAELAQRHDPYQGEGAWRRLAAALRDEAQWLEPMTPEALHRIDLPTLLVYGDRDPWVPLEQAVRLRRQLPEGRLLVVPDCGHVPVAERPSIVNPALLLFLRQARAAG